MAALMWMSTPRYGAWVPCWQSNQDQGRNGVSEKTKFLDGGTFVKRSPASARSYGATWVGTSAELQPIMSMYEGSYGPGPYYFIDPMATQNILPPGWADPYLSSQDGGWPSLMRGVKATSVVNPIISAYMPPTFAAVYTLPTVIPTFNVLTPRCTLAIPPNATLRLTLWGTVSGAGNAVYRINRYNRSTGAMTTQDVTPTSTGAAVSFAGSTYSHIEIWITKQNTGPATITPAGSVANLAASAPTLWYPGEGHGGVEFSDDLTNTAYNTNTGGLRDRRAISVTLEEVGPWLQ